MTIEMSRNSTYFPQYAKQASVLRGIIVDWLNDKLTLFGGNIKIKSVALPFFVNDKNVKFVVSIEAARMKYNDEFVFRVVPDLVEGVISITHCGFTDDDHEFGEYREINYGYKELMSKVVAINKFDVHFDVRKSQYYLSDDIRIVLDNWLFHKITLPGNWSVTTLMSREFKILIGGEEVARPSKE